MGVKENGFYSAFESHFDILRCDDSNFTDHTIMKVLQRLCWMTKRMKDEKKLPQLNRKTIKEFDVQKAFDKFAETDEEYLELQNQAYDQKDHASMVECWEKGESNK